jgi:hypothetical protein
MIDCYPLPHVDLCEPDAHTLPWLDDGDIKIKTAVSASDYLKAVGQLLVYEKG